MHIINSCSDEYLTRYYYKKDTDKNSPWTKLSTFKGIKSGQDTYFLRGFPFQYFWEFAAFFLKKKKKVFNSLTGVCVGVGVELAVGRGHGG